MLMNIPTICFLLPQTISICLSSSCLPLSPLLSAWPYLFCELWFLNFKLIEDLLTQYVEFWHILHLLCLFSLFLVIKFNKHPQENKYQGLRWWVSWQRACCVSLRSWVQRWHTIWQARVTKHNYSLSTAKHRDRGRWTIEFSGHLVYLVGEFWAQWEI